MGQIQRYGTLVNWQIPPECFGYELRGTPERQTAAEAAVSQCY